MCPPPFRSRRREWSAVISRPRAKAPASQAGAACVPSSQSFTAENRLTTAHRSQRKTLQEALHLFLEPPSPFRVIAKHVEARAGRGQQDHSPRLGERKRLLHRGLE